MKKAKILSLLIMVLLVAAVFASLAFTSMAATPADPADADDFLDVVWTDETQTQFTLKGIVGGPWDAKYADPEDYPFLIASMPKADKGTSNAAYTAWEGTYKSSEAKAGEVAAGDVKCFANHFNGSGWGATGPAKTVATTTIDAYVFMRSETYTIKNRPDGAVNSDGTAKPEEQFNLSQNKGNVYFNFLGGSIIAPSDLAANPTLFNVQAKTSGSTNSTFYVENGTFELARGNVLRLDGGNLTDSDINNITFTNCTFSLSEGTTATEFVYVYRGGTGALFSASFNDCVFDLDIEAPTNNFVIFKNLESTANFNATVMLNGGEIRASDFTKLSFGTFYDDASYTSGKLTETVSFNVGEYDGEYPKLIVTCVGEDVSGSAFAPSKLKLYNSKEERLGFSCTAIGDTTKTYELVNITADTFVFEGMEISVDYLSTVEYPFIVIGEGDINGKKLIGLAKAFNQDFTIGADKDYNSQYDIGAMGMASLYTTDGNSWNAEADKYLESRTAYIYMRRDYTLQIGQYYDSSKQVTYFTTERSHANFGQSVKGNIVIDLMDHTISGVSQSEIDTYAQKNGLAGSDIKVDYNFFFYMEAKRQDTCPVIGVAVKNGDIVMNSTGLIRFRGRGDQTGKIFNLLFEDVKVNANGAVIPFTFTKNEGTDHVVNFDCVNCEFDYSECTASSLTLFECGSTSLRIHMNMYGGKIKVGDKAYTLYGTNGGKMSFYSKYDETNTGYTEFESDNQAPPTTVNDGKLTFKAASTDGTTTTYVLMPTVALNYTPKTSVTLGSDLTLNIYIPYTTEFSSMWFDLLGAEEKILAADITEDFLVTLEDGKKYIHVESPMSAFEAAAVLPLCVELEIDGSLYTGKWSISIPKYVEKVLAKSDIDDTEKTLAKDILAYIRSAFALEGLEDSDEVKEMDKILGTYTSKNVINVQNAIKDSDLVGATFVLDSTPAVRFYIGDYDYKSFTFFVDGKAVDKEFITRDSDDEYGAYVDISLYAYQMTETFSYVIDVEDGDDIAGYYNLIAYYAYVSGDGEKDYVGADKALLTDLVAKFYNYCASAAAYREYVIANQ